MRPRAALAASIGPTGAVPVIYVARHDGDSWHGRAHYDRFRRGAERGTLSGLEPFDGPLFLREHARAWRELQSFGRAALELEHRGGGLLRCDRVERKRLSVVYDVNDLAGAVDEEHVERYISVLHPHRDRLFRGVEEQHPLIVLERFHEHEAACPAHVIVSDPNTKTMNARIGRRDLQRTALEHAIELRGVARGREAARQKGCNQKANELSCAQCHRFAIVWSVGASSDSKSTVPAKSNREISIAPLPCTARAGSVQKPRATTR